MINKNVEARTQLLRELGDEMTSPDGDVEAPDAEARIAGFDRRIDDIYVTRLQIYLLKYLLKFINNFLGQLGPLSILLLGGYLVIEGRTEVGTIVAFLSGYERMVDPARELLAFYRRLSRMRVQYRLVADAVT
jgi:ABC-type bacteriocin/lantibiotic exporter with double-glycine peptidase domain